MNYKLKFTDGDFIVIDENVVIKDFENKDQTVKTIVRKKIAPKFTMKTSWAREAFMAGFIQGDGATGQLDSPTHKGIEVCFGKDDGDIAKIFGCKIGKIYSEEFSKIAKKYGISSKPIPERPLSSKNASNNDFLAGLFSANGSVDENYRVSFKCTNQQVVNALIKSLKSKGIATYKTTQKAAKVKFKNGTYNCKESYILNIGLHKDLVKFASKIGFGQKYKQSKLKKLINKKSLIVVSAEKTLEKITSCDIINDMGVFV